MDDWDTKGKHAELEKKIDEYQTLTLEPIIDFNTALKKAEDKKAELFGGRLGSLFKRDNEP